MVNTKFIIINFASNFILTQKVYEYISTFMTNKMTIEEDNIVIEIVKDKNKTIKEIKQILQKYLNSDNIYENHKISEFDNILTVGIPKSIFDISNSKFCEICGFQMSNEEELLVHRRCHGIF
ncbi:MAG: hypothetical protein ACPKQO_04260 [Nitrososphaeraceae archaeon]